MRLVSYWPYWVITIGLFCGYYMLTLQARRYGLDVTEYLKMQWHRMRTPNWPG